jgi:hypothetical protein
VEWQEIIRMVALKWTYQTAKPEFEKRGFYLYEQEIRGLPTYENIVFEQSDIKAWVDNNFEYKAYEEGILKGKEIESLFFNNL